MVMYRSLLHSSSMHEPRGPPLEVVNDNLTRHKLDAKRTTTSQKKQKTRGRGGGSAVPPPWPGSPADPVARAMGVNDHREPPPVPHPGPRTRGANGARGSRENVSKTLMILMRVHLRKPCYDFYFL